MAYLSSQRFERWSRLWPKLGAAALFAGVALQAASASAAPAPYAYGRQGNFSVGVERLFGVYTNHTSVEQRTGNDLNTDSTQIGFLYQEQRSGFAIPRLTFDYFLIDNLSLGTALGYYSFSTTTQQIENQTGYIFAPRVGYNVAFNAQFGIVPHAGLTYIHESQRLRNADDDLDSSQFALALDGMFYFMPVPSVGFTGAVILDLGITGSQQDAMANINDRHERLIGVAFGMFAHF